MRMLITPAGDTVPLVGTARTRSFVQAGNQAIDWLRVEDPGFKTYHN